MDRVRIPGESMFKPDVVVPTKGVIKANVGQGFCPNCGSFMIVDVEVGEPNALQSPIHLNGPREVKREITARLFSKEFICLRCREYQHAGPYWANDPAWKKED